MKIDKQKPIISPDIKVYDLLEAYPELEDVLIGITPVFKKLKNPVLRKTIAKVTTLKQAAIVGKVSINEMIKKLREKTGQSHSDIAETLSENSPEPEWLKDCVPAIVYDVREDIDNGIQPLNKVIRDVQNFSDGEIYKLITAFIPAPLIQVLIEKKFECYTVEVNPDLFETYCRKFNAS